MFQQGQVFKLKAKSRDGQPLWAYRYRIEGRGSVRPQVGGFATRADALDVGLMGEMRAVIVGSRRSSGGWTNGPP
jgi:hypothetical protein